MCSVLIAIPGGHGGQRRGGSGGSSAMCRKLAPWKVGWENVIGILVSLGKKKGKRRKSPVLATVECTFVCDLSWLVNSPYARSSLGYHGV